MAGAATITAITNSAASGNGPIQSWILDLTTGTATAAGSFIPQGAVPGGINGPSPNGRAIAVTNTQFYYTELGAPAPFGPTVQIEAGLYNGGAGSPDNGNVANPTPGLGISVLEFAPGVSGGNLYALAGYIASGTNVGPIVYVFNPANGAIVLPPVTMQTGTGADGFTVLPNGNYLINRGDAENSYDQYNPVTGARIAGTNFSVSGCSSSTGVTTDGTNLFFNCNLSSIAETNLSGTLIHNFALPGAHGDNEDISLISNFSPPPPNSPEPTSVLLLGTGLTMLGLRLRKKNRSCER
jgi:hypothetical protein